MKKLALFVAATAGLCAAHADETWPQLPTVETVLTEGSETVPVVISAQPTVSTEYAGWYAYQATQNTTMPVIDLVFSGTNTIGKGSSDNYQNAIKFSRIWVTNGVTTLTSPVQDVFSAVSWNVTGGSLTAGEFGAFLDSNAGTAATVAHNFYGGTTDVPIWVNGSANTHPDWAFNVYNDAVFAPRAFRDTSGNMGADNYKVTVNVYGGTFVIPSAGFPNLARLVGQSGVRGQVVARSGNATFAKPVVLNEGARTAFVAEGDHTIDFTSSVSGAGTLEVAGGSVNLTKATLTGFTGNILVSGGELTIRSSDFPAERIITSGEGVVNYLIDKLIVGEDGEVNAASLAAYLAASEGDVVLEVANGTTATISTDLSLGSRNFVKQGEGVLYLRGANDWTGETFVKKGALVAKDGVGLPSSSRLVFDGGTFAPIQAEGEVFTRSEGGGFRYASGDYAFSAIENPVVINVGGEGTSWTPISWKTLALNRFRAAHPITVENPLPLKGLTIRVGYTPETGAYLPGGIPSNNGNSMTIDGCVYVSKVVMSGNQMYLAGGGNMTVTGEGSLFKDQTRFGHTPGESSVTFARGSTGTLEGEWTWIGEVSGNTATMTVNGTVTAKDTTTVVGEVAGATGTLVVGEDGTYITRRIQQSGGTGYVTLDGGTIRASDNANPDWIMGLTGFTVGAKGGTLDTQAKDVRVNAKEALQAVGRMTKTGSGKLIVHSLAFNGGLTLAEGTLAVAADAPGAAYGITGSLAHRWSFSGTLADAVDADKAFTGVNGNVAKNPVTVNPDSVTIAGSGTYADGAHIELATGLLPYAKVATVEFWVTPNWFPTKRFDLLSVGSGTGDDLRICGGARSGSNTSQPYICLANDVGKTTGTLKPMVYNAAYHYILTVDSSDAARTVVTLYQYKDGDLLGTATFTSTTWKLATVVGRKAFVNGSWHTGDTGKMTANYDEFRVWNGLLSEAQRAATDSEGPDKIPEDIDFTAELPHPGIVLAANAVLDATSGVKMAEEITLVGGAKIVGAGGLDLSACTLKLGEATATEAAIRDGHGSWLVAMTTDGQVILPEGFRRTVKEAKFGLKVSEDGASVYVTHAPGFIMIVR